jgi:hypothetical protein
MPTAQQKTLNAQRRRRRDGGMVRVEVQVPEIDAGMLRELAAILRGKSDAAQAMRSQLRSVVAKSRAESVFDIFGSDLSDGYFEGVFEQMRRGDTPRDVDL